MKGTDGVEWRRFLKDFIGKRLPQSLPDNLPVSQQVVVLRAPTIVDSFIKWSLDHLVSHYGLEDKLGGPQDFLSYFKDENGTADKDVEDVRKWLSDLQAIPEDAKPPRLAIPADGKVTWSTFVGLYLLDVKCPEPRCSSAQEPKSNAQKRGENCLDEFMKRVCKEYVAGINYSEHGQLHRIMNRNDFWMRMRNYGNSLTRSNIENALKEFLKTLEQRLSDFSINYRMENDVSLLDFVGRQTNLGTAIILFMKEKERELAAVNARKMTGTAN
ncbi:hypothetical protein BV898_07905 [Hypsibius exemplaris]|uniref:Uncharacterized protein n=1 Tax=Hypsibius exemplaris TaxID=2072580 RepID=A0A1W0WRX9_HYPEX|nr:hypothetical protein BV898_07905 [Hypsibius exemplaris]